MKFHPAPQSDRFVVPENQQQSQCAPQEPHITEWIMHEMYRVQHVVHGHVQRNPRVQEDFPPTGDVPTHALWSL